MIEKYRILLIGGTSHVGKSTLAQLLALKLGWNYRSTDKLARHPGRPWQPKAEDIPKQGLISINVENASNVEEQMNMCMSAILS